MYELDKVPNESHHRKSNRYGLADLRKFLHKISEPCSNSERLQTLWRRL
jgi:hypothetical protein